MRRLFNTSLLLFFSILATSIPSSAQDTMTLQIHPYLPASELIRRFTPLVEYLSTKTNKKIICNISRDYEEHIKMIGSDKADIAFVGPASYVKIVNDYGKKPMLARLEVNGVPTFRGVIITRIDSPIKSLADLKDKKFAFGDPHSTMSYLVPLYMLQKAGIHKNDLSRHDFVKSHQNVALGVLMGDYDAGAIKEEVFYQYKERGLRDIAWSPKISEHIFVTRASLHQDTIIDLRNALLKLKDEKSGRAIMSSIKEKVTAFIPAQDEDFNDLRSILRSVAQSNSQ